MKKIVIILIFAFIIQYSFGQITTQYTILIKKADSLYNIKEYKNAALEYSSAFKTRAWKGKPEDRYKGALAWALANVPDSAFHYLERIANYAHYSEYDTIVNQKEFYLLHADKRWKPLLTRIEQNILPKGCFRSGNKSYHYEMFIDYNEGQTKNDVFSIKSIDDEIDGFGALLQNSLPKEFLGKKIRMTGLVKSEDVSDWAGLFVKVVHQNPEVLESFDNMKNRPIKGTTNWKTYEVVLFVPLNATNISFGAMLYGTGQIWFDKLKFEVVDLSVPVTVK